MPHACPSCGNADLQPVGIGTQRVEERLQERFPEARILRVDRDSTRTKGRWKAMREQIHDGKRWIFWSARKCWRKGTISPT